MDIGCQWVILGHSERRHVIGEDDQVTTNATEFVLLLVHSLIVRTYHQDVWLILSCSNIVWDFVTAV